MQASLHPASTETAKHNGQKDGGELHDGVLKSRCFSGRRKGCENGVLFSQRTAAFIQQSKLEKSKSWEILSDPVLYNE